MRSLTIRRSTHLLQDSRTSPGVSLTSPRSSRLRKVPTKTVFSAPGHFSTITTNPVSCPYPETLRYDQLRAPLRCAHAHFQRLRNAMAFPFVHDGIPIVYYGMVHSLQSHQHG